MYNVHILEMISINEDLYIKSLIEFDVKIVLYKYHKLL